MIEETLEMLSWGIGSVIPNEIYNEAMDYCEWKNGYRTEAMTGVAKGLITKIQNVIMNVFNNIVMQKIGYVQGMKIGTQANNTKFWLFVLSTGLPTITRMLGVVPKFYYNLSAEKREKMYEELFERRKAMTAAMAGADEQEMARLGKAQMNGEFLSDTKL
jgi:Na+/melibiose symporter-like transporter